ncbi:aldo/keto reductase [Candidatus Cetobacterium colombiensis]|jgi:predicted oxidoreductase|uniref:Aldo/keto reductase n=1 Tax=Candidatus Cetobacterium colombiensis TaxID=3073100 RepID=A0ABU4WAD8_9FUSO|nr:aldo/keto reductase [Candidatus Cetobacterium colombiensis]MDX8335541.1 aldo/keto reductase [Candidatus Cetobacterium colombiensis]
MEYVELSKDLKMSKIALGFWRLNDWKMSKEDLLKYLEEAIDLGVTTFDHADIYGSYTCEKIFGEALALKPELRSKMQLVSKVGIKLISKNMPENTFHCYDTSYNHIVKSVEKSLKNLNVEYLDLVLIHRPDMYMDADETAKALTDLKKAGKVLEWGVSNFLPSDFNLLQSRLDFKLVTNQIELSPLKTQHFYDGTINLMQEKRVPMMIWSPLAGGEIFTSSDENVVELRKILEKLGKKYNCSIDTIVYAWHLAHPANLIPICGSGKISRLKSAVEACKVSLTREEWFDILVNGMGKDIP